MLTTNKLEQTLLDKELREISQKLAKLGEGLIAIFAKYPTIQGQHKDELREYLVTQIIAPYESYYAGYTTVPSIATSTKKLPDTLKSVILEWVINDFMNKLDEVKALCDNNEVGCGGGR